ncbi:putative F-box/FBD/LRR-repeat protein [Cardamine amara subsp. amara]|uniref:F-box/FBD/LRR-repeat protein n=1 Tax=Cardamine amara subsp. amara TaxID=228776 RepID=A0ABD0ZC54_CARAN
MGLLRIDPETKGCQRLCDLPDALLVRILLLVPAKDAVATAILSKQWRYVWKMLHKLVFKDDQGRESFGWFIDKSLQLHKAPKLVSLVVTMSC